jgi:hypothetical protein
MRTILKLVVVALIANATWHVFGAYAPHYKLVDGAQSAAQFRGDLTDDGLREKVLFLASQLDIPLSEDDVKVTHDVAHTTIDFSYVRQIELAPGIIQRWPFTGHAEVLNSRPPAGEPLR